MERSWTGTTVAAARIARWLVFAVLPLLVASLFLASALRYSFGFDFRVFWSASRDVLDGRSPYPDPAAIAAASAPAMQSFFVYPPLVAIAVAPLATLPFAVAAASFTILLAACLAAALRLLDVRDWRCYALLAASLPVLSSLRLGAITPVLVLALAAAWRYRDRWALTGAAIGAATAAKLFVWPLVLWLLLTRRFRAAACSAAVGVGLTAATWAVIGFRGLTAYPALLHALSSGEAARSYSLVAASERLHLPAPGASWLALAVPLAALVLALACAAPRAQRDGALFAAAVGIALLLTPILWLHYFTLLVVPIAIGRRSFGEEWLVLLAFWLTPVTEPAQLALWRIALALILVGVSLTRLRRPEAARELGRKWFGGARIAPRPTLSRLPGGKP